MGITLNSSVNYPSPLIALPSFQGKEPVEGRKSVPCEIDWATMGGAGKTVAFNLQNNATLNISQILALKIDNSACGGDIQFIFPDTSETVSVPAYEPDVIVPVFTNGLQFYVVCPNEITIDITRFQILNYCPPPISISPTTGQSVASANSIQFNSTITTQVIPVTVSGTIEAIMLMANTSTGGTGISGTILVQDGTGKNVASAAYNSAAGVVQNIQLVNLTGMSVRFSQGLSIIITLTTAPGVNSGPLSYNILYRTP